MSRYRNAVLATAALCAGCLIAASAQAGTYAKVNQSDWQQSVTGLPTYVNMYSYMPATVASKPPVVVYCHQCTGTAQNSHDSMGSLEKIADSNGFIIIYPEATGENCWDAGSKRSLAHGGGGDTGAVVQMVKYVIGKYNADPNRVYVSGPSSGGIMTEALLGVYPDVFMAGVSIMGVPCGCWGESYNDVTGKPANGTGQWSGPCSGGTVTKTGQQWGDLVRSYFPSYTGHRPRLQHWHGATDTTLNFKNVAEDIKEWTNLLALSEAPTATEENTPKSGTTHQAWKNSCYTVYETFVLANVGHMVSVDGPTLAKYFGIDTASTQDPETAACPGAVPGGGSGAGGAGGGGSGGAAGSSGGGADAGQGGGGGSTHGSDAAQAGSGGSNGTGGAAPGTGGSVGGAGASGTGGAVTNGGHPGEGGSSANGSGGTVGTGGNSASGGSSATGGNKSSGGCHLGNRAAGSNLASTMLVIAGLAWLAGRRRARRR